MSGKSFNIGPTPKFVEGGCLCGALRYRIDFPENHDFAANVSSLFSSDNIQSNNVAQSMICQCTQCRKGTASLFFVAHRVEPASGAFRWTKEPATLKDYSASPGALRGFCSVCGSQVYWRRKGLDRISFAVGTVDALYMFGEGADGVEVPMEGFGKALASGLGQCEWAGNEIKGVTDDMPLLFRGRRSLGDDEVDVPPQ